MKKCFCSIILGCLLGGVAYADEFASKDSSGLSFSVGLDYGFYSVARTINVLKLNQALQVCRLKIKLM